MNRRFCWEMNLAWRLATTNSKRTPTEPDCWEKTAASAAFGQLIAGSGASVQDPPASMLLLWLICHLTVVTSSPTGLPVTRIRQILEETVNDTETLLNHDYHEQREQRVCETVHCNQIAKKLLESMDTSEDPCNNFYQYACGSWDKHNHIPDNRVDWSEDHVIMRKTDKRLKALLEEPDKTTDIIPVKMARKLYRSCMNVDAIERRGIKPIQDILDSTGGWPMAMPYPSWNSHKFPWQRIDKHYATLFGSSVFYNIEYEVDQNNTHRYVLTLDQETEYSLLTKRGLSKIFSENDKYALGIYRIIETFAENKGHHVHQRQVIRDVGKMVAFEIVLLKIFEEGKKSHASTEIYERMTIEELQKWYNNGSFATASTAKINFLEVLQHVFKPANISVNASEPIVVYNPVFLHKLARLLGNTPQRVIVNYIQWNMINKFLPFTTEQMRNILFNMTYSSYNISSYVPRWEVCVLNMHMEDAVSYMFVKKYVSDDVIDKAKDVVRRVKEELNHRIMRSHWLTDTAKTALARKLHLVNMQVGYPEWYKDDQAVIRFYEGLQIGVDYFQNLLNCAKHELISSLKEFRGTVNRTDWLDYPITVNSFYTPEVNAINIPAAEIQEPYFTPHLPDAINYGAIGFITGHELSHSFDSEGIKFDASGRKFEWLPQNIMDVFNNRTLCFVNQFFNYTLDVLDRNGENVMLDGQLTENENLADAAGAQVAFAAYHKIAHQKTQMKLPGLENFTDDQLFFLKFANSWCSHVRPEYEADAVNSDEHSPPKYRVIGALSNMAAFSEAFQCPQNSSMNRPNKCTLWS